MMWWLMSGVRLQDSNRPFPSFPGPLFQNESRCSAFDMEIIFHSQANKTHFHKKGCAPSLILKVRVFGTRRWPIDRRITSGKAKWARDWAGASGWGLLTEPEMRSEGLWESLHSSSWHTECSFLAKEPHQLVDEYINADDVIAFCFYLMNKMRRNLIKIRSYAILK